MSQLSTPAPDLSAIKAMHLDADDLNVAASILYNAYFDDATLQYIFQAEKEGYDSRLRSAIREELYAFWDSGQTLIGLFEENRMLAVTCLAEPGSGFAPGKMWHWRVKMMLTAGLFSTRQLVEKEENILAAIPASHFHMIVLIGVHPDHQHRGLGHILLGAIDNIVINHSDSEGVGVFATLSYYQRFFEDDAYQHVKQLEVAQITGNILFKNRPANE
ncbi:N-acetyltransferase [Salinimonas chungwhensis]|uniref:N-acetyltransferase n=1 Tax=Salinimonas chungwhensis TaxID=265425 RepID=UPI000377D804|nr:N-acetyltransferase [Salinimonas chungwhensis]